MYRIFIGQLGAAGDILYVTSIAHQLRMDYPIAYIEWGFGKEYCELLENNKDIDNIKIFNWPRKSNYLQMHNILKEINKYAYENFDIVIIPMIFPDNYSEYLNNDLSLIDNLEKNANVFPMNRKPIIIPSESDMKAVNLFCKEKLGCSNNPVIGLEYNTYSLYNPFTLSEYKYFCKEMIMKYNCKIITFSRSDDPKLDCDEIIRVVDSRWQQIYLILNKCNAFLSISSGITALAYAHLPKLFIIQAFHNELRYKKDNLIANGFNGVALLKPKIDEIINIISKYSNL